MLIAYFSWTGNTEKVASRIAANFSNNEVAVYRIVPIKERDYWAWLLLSFLPGSRVQILPHPLDVSKFDLIVLGCPKWTFSCPPFNEFVSGMKNQLGKNAAFFTTYGGFDEERFVSSIVRKLGKNGMNVRSQLLVKRDRVQSGSYVQSVDDFCKNLLKDLPGDRSAGVPSRFMVS